MFNAFVLIASLAVIGPDGEPTSIELKMGYKTLTACATALRQLKKDFGKNAYPSLTGCVPIALKK